MSAPVAQFVQFHPEDTRKGLSPIIFTDPRKFTPEPLRPGEVLDYSWGVKMEFNMDTILAQLERRFSTAFLYSRVDGDNKLPYPEEQFCSYFRDQNLHLLNEVDNSLRRDYTLRVKLTKGGRPSHIVSDSEDQVWRLVRVSGGMPLQAFADKVLLPVLGMCRNYHGYHWIHQSPPHISLYPKGHGAIDFKERENVGWALIDDKQYRVGNLFKPVVGDSVLFTYDLGDRWRFIVRVDHVGSVEESSGAVEVLDGGGPTPPEDSCGWDRGKMGFFEAVKRRLLDPRRVEQALNYNGKGGRAKETFSYQFNLERAKEEVKHALASPASNFEQPKIVSNFVAPVQGQFTLPPNAVARNASEKMVVSPLDDSRQSFLIEKQNTGRDIPDVSVCANCGSPGDLTRGLRYCQHCKKVRYCSRACQRSAWSAHKSQCMETTETAVAKCSVCGSTTGELKRCGRCHGTLYCSRDCQVKDWASHKPRCVASAEIK